jgi:hypothetical protein
VAVGVVASFFCVPLSGFLCQRLMAGRECKRCVAHRFLLLEGGALVIADQLGHARSSMTHDVYMVGRPLTSEWLLLSRKHLVMGGRRTGRAARGATGSAGLFV